MAKKILIATYAFFPVIIPRGNQAFELAKEFTRQGHDVTVLIADNPFNYSEIMQRSGMEIIKVKPGFILNVGNVFDGFLWYDSQNNQKMELTKENYLKKLLRKTFRLTWVQKLYKLIYLQGNSFEYTFTLLLALLKLKKKYDLYISIGLPISVHLGSAIALAFKPKIANIRIADYSDPFTANFSPTIFKQKINCMIEGLILKQFQFISIPHAQALSTYLNFKKRSQIKIIPQGVNRENYTQQTWKAHPDKVRFAYAGRFFLDIRNPESLFQFLESVTQNFEFTIYTSLQDQLIIDMLNKYNLRLNNRLIIHHFIPRQQLIYELSGYDFLINMNNTRANQSPSKQLDYALTGRPVLNINQDNLHLPIFQDFLQKDFSSWKPQINLDNHTSSFIGQQFLALLESGKQTT